MHYRHQDEINGRQVVVTLEGYDGTSVRLASAKGQPVGPELVYGLSPDLVAQLTVRADEHRGGHHEVLLWGKG